MKPVEWESKGSVVEFDSIDNGIKINKKSLCMKIMMMMISLFLVGKGKNLRSYDCYRKFKNVF